MYAADETLHKTPHQKRNDLSSSINAEVICSNLTKLTNCSSTRHFTVFLIHSHTQIPVELPGKMVAYLEKLAPRHFRMRKVHLSHACYHLSHSGPNTVSNREVFSSQTIMETHKKQFC